MTIPTAKAALQIHASPAKVFEAFVDPGIITKFWFDRSSGRLEKGKTVEWHWTDCGASSKVRVIDLVENRRIHIEGDSNTGRPTSVEWTFEPQSDGSTFVSVVNSGFAGSGDEIVSAALDATGGFNLVLAAAKAYLEHSINLNIVRDIQLVKK